MWKCRQCGEAVFFAERRQSLGFDWHRQCLRCQECGKVLHPGQHAEHKEKPYCHIPCYSALFGPKLFGHGSTVESHQSFGKAKRRNQDHEDVLMERKVRQYNDHIENNLQGSRSRLQITSRQVNGRLVMEGVLRVHWAVERSIRLKEFHDTKASMAAKRRPTSFHPALAISITSDSKIQDSGQAAPVAAVDVTNLIQRTLLQRTLSDSHSSILDKESTKADEDHLVGCHTLPAHFGRDQCAALSLRLDRYEALVDLSKDCTPPAVSKWHRLSNLHMDASSCKAGEHTQKRHQPVDDDSSSHKVSTVEKTVRGQGARALRRRAGRKFDKNALILRRSSFNGHWYDRETSVFTPPKDSSMSVWVTSVLQTKEVLQMLLDKYQVQCDHSQFALFVVKDNGERRQLLEQEFPLRVRVLLGPCEEAARLYVLDRVRNNDVKPEVAQFLRFSYAECRAILHMYYEEEEREVEYIRRKYKVLRKMLAARLMQCAPASHCGTVQEEAPAS